jgi:hypothetical protein
MPRVVRLHLMSTWSLRVLACVATVAALAQSGNPGPLPAKPILGKAINVQGLVTVSDDAGVSRVLVNNSVIDHSRYVTSSSGSVTLKLDKGCEIVLKPNQALTVEHEKSCDGLWAAIESLGNPSGVLLAGGAANLVPFAAGGAVVLLMGNRGGTGTGAGNSGNSGNTGNTGNSGDGGNNGNSGDSGTTDPGGGGGNGNACAAGVGGVPISCQ